MMIKRRVSYVLSVMLSGVLGGSEKVIAAELLTVNKTAALVQTYCSQCHAPPNPANHQPQLWRQIVNRMQSHRIMRGFGKIPAQDAAKLIAYLEKQAKR